MSESNRFGRYEVEEEVARGGMGVIYRVRDPEMRRFLAMKVLLSDLGGEQEGSGSHQSKLAARFVDEAQLTGQLDHPGIIPVYDMGRDADGRLFFTMRLVKGRTLEEIFGLVRSGAEGWSVTRALGVLQKVCEAMGFAHEHGVIHRDLKPANVMIGRFGETYVMDWGLAKLMGGEEGAEPAPRRARAPLATVLSSARKDESSRGGELDTLEGDVMGTPAYMAPEQARGEIERVDGRSDVYAVGAMLYHLLAGHAPYRSAGETPYEVLQRLLAGPPAPLEKEAGGAPAELIAICERAMAREPERRYAGMLDLAEDLQAYVENRVVQAYRRGAVVEFKKWVLRNRATAASLAVLVVIVVAGLAAVSYVQTRARDVVERKNDQLAATNVELEAQRQRTDEARTLAEQNEVRAVENERIALANEEEALWQSYLGNIAAAEAEMVIGSASGARRRLAACAESLRGWEWEYLSQRANGSLATLTGSETFVMSLAVDPVSPHVAAAGGMVGNSGSPDYAVRVWDYEAGELVQELDGHRTSVTGLAYSPTGGVLASSDAAGELRLWEVETGALLAEARIGGHIDYHPDGRWIVGASTGDGGVTLWDSYDLVVVATATLPAGANAVRFSPDGESIAVAGKDHHVRILDSDLSTRLDLDASGESPGGEELFDFPKGPGVYSVDFSPDGTRLVSGSGDGFVRIWDLATGERLHFLDGHRSIVQAVRWHPRFPWIVSSDSSGTIRFWDADTGVPLDVLRGHDEVVHALGFSELGDRLLSASRDTTVRVWDGQAGANDTLLEGFSFPNFGPYKLAFAPDSERIAWRSGREAVSITDVRTGEDLCAFWTLDPFSIAALEFVGDEVWECSRTGRLSVWDATTGERLSAAEVSRAAPACAFWPEERAAVVSDTDRLLLVELGTGTVRWTVPLDRGARAIALSADGELCVVAQGGAAGGASGASGALLGFETATGTPLWEVPDMPEIHRVEFLPDGERFAHTTFNVWDKRLPIRSAETGELVAAFEGHAQPAVLDVSPDGSRIVTGNWDGTISLWSPERGEILALPAHARHATQVAFSPDGRTVASLGDDGRRRLWSASAVETRQAARAAAARRRRWSADARARVDELFRTRVHPPAVVAALEADPTLQPEQRQAATFLARTRVGSLEELVERSITIAMQPGRTGAEYMAALEGARLAIDLVPSVAEIETYPPGLAAEVAPKIAALHWAVGLAQVRLGLPHEAIASAERAEDLQAAGVSWTSPLFPLLKGLAHDELGEREAAEREHTLGRDELRIGNPLLDARAAQAGRLLERELRARLDRD